MKKRPYQIKNKAKVALLLAVLMVIIALNNLWERKSFSRLERSIASIYQDRLLPATYLYEISSHLYQKKLLLEKGAGTPGINEHNHAINKLIKSYELTYLTDAEKRQWALFKTHLSAYNREEEQQQPSQLRLDKSFTPALATLNRLSQIQAGEGRNLQHSSKGIIDGSLLASHLEIAILIILGIAAMALINMRDRNIFQTSQN
jgi:hypothetical protein